MMWRVVLLVIALCAGCERAGHDPAKVDEAGTVVQNRPAVPSRSVNDAGEAMVRHGQEARPDIEGTWEVVSAEQAGIRRLDDF